MRDSWGRATEINASRPVVPSSNATLLVYMCMRSGSFVQVTCESTNGGAPGLSSPGSAFQTGFT